MNNKFAKQLLKYVEDGNQKAIKLMLEDYECRDSLIAYGANEDEPIIFQTFASLTDERVIAKPEDSSELVALATCTSMIAYCRSDLFGFAKYWSVDSTGQYDYKLFELFKKIVAAGYTPDQVRLMVSELFDVVVSA